MVTDLELAVLAYRSYVPSDSKNVTAPNWVENTDLRRESAASGFAARVYRNGDEVVIAFRGTNTPLWRDFLYGNIPAARGGLSAQIAEAIKLVADARNAYPNATITLTGHSLGGGLAAAASLIGEALGPASAMVGEAVSVLISPRAMLLGLVSPVALEGSRLLAYERYERPDWGRVLP